MAFIFLRETIHAYREKDPAARSGLEVLLCYPGLHALMWHSLAHNLWRAGFRVTGRLVSYLSRWLTGIEIHPGARIGRRVIIDHGMGVVIGETAEVGDDVTFYHGVTLGGRGWWVDHKGEKRHPTIGDRVTLGVGATILGPITVGSGSRVGPGALVIEDVPPDSTVVAPLAVAIRVRGRSVEPSGEPPPSARW